MINDTLAKVRMSDLREEILTIKIFLTDKKKDNDEVNSNWAHTRKN